MPTFDSQRTFTSHSTVGYLLWFVFSAVVLGVSIYWMVLFPGRGAERLLLTAAIWLGLCAVIGRVWLAALLVSPLLILAPVEMFLLHEFSYPLSGRILGIIYESSTAEAWEFLSTKVGWVNGVLQLLFVVGLGICIYGLCRQQVRWLGPTRVLVASLLIGVSASFYALSINMRPPAASDELSSERLSYMSQRVLNTFPFGVPLRLIEFKREVAAIDRARGAIERFKFDARTESDAPKTIVLVLGESARSDRWQLNGYQRATNPLLSKEDIVFFSNMTTLVTATRLAVPFILQRRPPNVLNPAAFPEKSLVAAFKEAGYQTWWFSNQLSVGWLESSATLLARDAHTVRYINPAGYSGKGSFDEELVPYLKEALQSPHAKKLIVLHTLGSHLSYHNRYPPRFHQFQPSFDLGYAGLYRKMDQERVNNAYDNSILYTDYVLAQMIDQLKSSQQNAALWYVSDHGQVLFDGAQCNLFGHSFNSVHDLRTASFFWASTAFQKQYATKMQLLRSRKDAPLMILNTFDSLMDMGQVSIPGHTLAHSILSDQFKPRTQVFHPLRSTGIPSEFKPELATGECGELVLPEAKAVASPEAVKQ